MAGGEDARWLAEAEAAVIKDPEILGGEPVFRGTRMPVFMVAEMRRAGMSPSAIVTEYPSLTAKLVELAEVYAREYRPASGSGTPSLMPKLTAAENARRDAEANAEFEAGIGIPAEEVF